MRCISIHKNYFGNREKFEKGLFVRENITIANEIKIKNCN